MLTLQIKIHTKIDLHLNFRGKPTDTQVSWGQIDIYNFISYLNSFRRLGFVLFPRVTWICDPPASASSVLPRTTGVHFHITHIAAIKQDEKERIVESSRMV